MAQVNGRLHREESTHGKKGDPESLIDLLPWKWISPFLKGQTLQPKSGARSHKTALEQPVLEWERS